MNYLHKRLMEARDRFWSGHLYDGIPHQAGGAGRGMVYTALESAEQLGLGIERKIA